MAFDRVKRKVHRYHFIKSILARSVTGSGKTEVYLQWIEVIEGEERDDARSKLRDSLDGRPI